MSLQEKITYGIDLLNRQTRLNYEIDKYKLPSQTDISLIPKILEIIRLNLHGTESLSNLKYYFVLVVVVLYSPRCFVGMNMSIGLRKSISESIGISQEETISKIFNTSNIWFNHSNYFKNEFDIISKIVVNELRKK